MDIGKPLLHVCISSCPSYWWQPFGKFFKIIITVFACCFIWSAPLTSIDGWGIRLPLLTFEWTEASLLYISFFAWSRQIFVILNIVIRRTTKVIVTLKACCFIWLASPTSIVGRGIRLPLPTIEWTEASLFCASVFPVVCHIGDCLSGNFQSHYNCHCLLFYLVSIPSVDIRLGN